MPPEDIDFYVQLKVLVIQISIDPIFLTVLLYTIVLTNQQAEETGTHKNMSFIGGQLDFKTEFANRC